jgi:hypothetical protein
MSKRLQVIIEEDELEAIQKIARQKHVSVAEWVRQTLRSACQAQPSTDPKKKLESIREAVTNSFPTSDIGQMLGEIESGYSAE